VFSFSAAAAASSVLEEEELLLLLFFFVFWLVEEEAHATRSRASSRARAKLKQGERQNCSRRFVIFYRGTSMNGLCMGEISWPWP